MESQPKNPEFRNNPENFHPWELLVANLISYLWYSLSQKLWFAEWLVARFWC